MSSNFKNTGHMSSKDLGATDFFQKISWKISMPCPSHVPCSQMFPQTFKRKDQAFDS